MADWLLIMIAGLAGGMVNSIAGGGSFLTLSTLIYAGLPPITANASNTVALFPGTFASTSGYKSFRKPFPGVVFNFIISTVFLLHL